MTAGWDLAEIKAELAAAGADLHPDASMQLFQRPAAGAKVGLIVLDRAESVEGVPPYCVHGFASCIVCAKLCYLGSETHRVVADPDNKVYPICLECATEHIPADNEGPVDRIIDHLR